MTKTRARAKVEAKATLSDAERAQIARILRRWPLCDFFYAAAFECLERQCWTGLAPRDRADLISASCALHRLAQGFDRSLPVDIL